MRYVLIAATAVLFIGSVAADLVAQDIREPLIRLFGDNYRFVLYGAFIVTLIATVWSTLREKSSMQEGKISGVSYEYFVKLWPQIRSLLEIDLDQSLKSTEVTRIASRRENPAVAIDVYSPIISTEITAYHIKTVSEYDSNFADMLNEYIEASKALRYAAGNYNQLVYQQKHGREFGTANDQLYSASRRLETSVDWLAIKVRFYHDLLDDSLDSKSGGSPETLDALREEKIALDRGEEVDLLEESVGNGSESEELEPSEEQHAHTDEAPILQAGESDPVTRGWLSRTHESWLEISLGTRITIGVMLLSVVVALLGVVALVVVPFLEAKLAEDSAINSDLKLTLTAPSPADIANTEAALAGPTADANSASAPATETQNLSTTATPVPSSTAPVRTPTNSLANDSNLCSDLGIPDFEESFDTNDNQWIVADDIDNPYSIEERSIESGVYRYSVFFKEDAITTSPVPRVSPKDFRAFLDFTLTAKEGEGVARLAVKFRSDSGEYYTARFGDDGLYSLFIRQDETLMPVLDWSNSAEFDLSIGETNEFGVIADGWSITLCANGAELISLIDQSLNSTGRIAVGLSGTKGVSAIGAIDDVRVYTGDGSPQVPATPTP